MINLTMMTTMMVDSITLALYKVTYLLTYLT